MSFEAIWRTRKAVFLAVSVVALPAPGGAAHDDHKVTLCHVPRGNWGARHTITVGESSVDNHLDHGDTFGRCRGSNRDNAEAEKKLDRAEDKLERAKRDAERDRNLERAEDKLDRARRQEDRLDRAQDVLEREKRLTKARAVRDLELKQARIEADREPSRRRADETYRAKRREALDRYYETLEHIYATSD